VDFTINATESHAPGALAYQVAFGDGATDQNNTPTYCSSGPGPAAGDTWQLAHVYAKKGRYQASATVRANCTSDRVTVQVVITVG